ncbi:hypothetical protein CDD80_1343 [Ophiocordyceps camponoti-rufipedis]|uniref:Carrier domain-containing protein n=1 Tax=Ophiocordyceps camponoti-rufipedis TaxID=2004952 RepID=A0A2C5Z4A6_9HYPO|nr:hypothetical protein CDD80_1343 [Ophiocordyceps camponoti-rufipedis]
MDHSHQNKLSALLRQLHDLPPSHVRDSKPFRELQSTCSQHDKRSILSCIPSSSDASDRPLHLLHTLLTALVGSWPPSALVACYSRVMKVLSDEAKTLPDDRLCSLMEGTQAMVEASYGSLLDFIERSERPALRAGPGEDGFFTYRGLHELAEKLWLPKEEEVTRKKPVVALALANGPLLAALVVAVTTWYTAAPLNPSAGTRQFRNDVSLSGARYVLTTREIYESLELGTWAAEAGVRVCGGLIRNILAPLFSSGTAICSPGFEPSMFWDAVGSSPRPTWYYAAPTMHALILEGASERRTVLEGCRIRCMPISTPPLTYQLDRPGTSGISAGPELAILDGSQSSVSPNTIGRICVRGEPVFSGYLSPDGSLDRSSFTDSGWFDTGDMGYLDSEGYLYITGRSKEVINRGGELISPLEVEDAILAAAEMEDSSVYGRVSQVLAFSVPHAVLQEAVGVVLVTPKGKTRVDIRALHRALRSSLQRVKWPVLIVYMDDLPRRGNKVVRTGLAQRMRLPEVDDEMGLRAAHWQAVCPEAETGPSEEIECEGCVVDFRAVARELADVVPGGVGYHLLRLEVGDGFDVVLAPVEGGDSSWFQGELADEVSRRLVTRLDNYMLPNSIHILPDALPTDPDGRVSDAHVRIALDLFLFKQQGTDTQSKVTAIFSHILNLPSTNIPPDADFFSLGGDSLRAGRLLSALRSAFDVDIPLSLIFSKGTVRAIARQVETAGSPQMRSSSFGGSEQTLCSTGVALMALQLVPMVVVYPLRRALQWTAFVVLLSWTQAWPTHGAVAGRLVNVLVSIMLSRLVIMVVGPLLGIAAKWIMVGRLRQGVYPMWGGLHTRWWMADKMEMIFGMGVFGLSEVTRSLYCRLMGARVGRGVKLAGSSLGEYDLVDIGDGVELGQGSICRAFAVEGNASMYLGRITIGSNSSVGTASVVAPGSNIPADTCIGPNSCSWEVDDADEANRRLSSRRVRKPHLLLRLLFTVPLVLTAKLLSRLPWAAGLVGMMSDEPSGKEMPLRDTLDWFTAGERVGFHFLALILRKLFGPLLILIFTVVVKFVLDHVFGPLGAGPGTRSGAVSVWRAHLIRKLMPGTVLHEVRALFGHHYESTSVMLRLLGSQIGKRVYWPGNGPDIGDYHLVRVGDDVVFGSRSYMVTSDGDGSGYVTVRDGAMIADRVCLLPGVEVGCETIMGSGALARRDGVYDAGATYIGSKGGDSLCLSSSRRRETLSGDGKRLVNSRSNETLTETKQPSRDASKSSARSSSFSSTSSSGQDKRTCPSSVSPFGRAFYLGRAPYHVLGPFSIFCYSTLMTAFVNIYWNAPSVLSVQVVDRLMNLFVHRHQHYGLQILTLFSLTWIVIAILCTLQAVIALTVQIAAKWILLGRRQPGNYDWDKSSYCQRWQLLICVDTLIRRCYLGHGIIGMLTGTSWLSLYYRALGANIGKDCAIYANGRPSLTFTEPDLITLGDRVAIDDASVVAHINTRGKFDLNRLEIGSGCVLRSGSRLLSGAVMKEGSCLLEHTLVMGGDVVDEGCTMQGWPAERFNGSRIGMAVGEKGGV